MKHSALKKVLLPLAALAAVLLALFLWSHTNPLNALFHRSSEGVKDGVVFVSSMETGHLGTPDSVLTSGWVSQEEFWALMGEGTYWRPLWIPETFKPGVAWTFDLEVDGVVHRGYLYPEMELLLLDYEEHYYVTGVELQEGLAALDLRPNGSDAT